MVSKIPVGKFAQISKYLRHSIKSKLFSPNIFAYAECYLPGPSSTERGLPVRAMGSPTVRPAIDKYSHKTILKLDGILIIQNMPFKSIKTVVIINGTMS